MFWTVFSAVSASFLSAGALLVSVLAYRRAGLRDRRQGEYRDVRWEGDWVASGEGQMSFSLTNSGTTIAKRVHAVVYTKFADGDRRTLDDLGTFKPGETKAICSADSTEHEQVMLEAKLFGELRPKFEVRWRSPLGEPQFYEEKHPPIPQVF